VREGSSAEQVVPRIQAAPPRAAAPRPPAPARTAARYAAEQRAQQYARRKMEVEEGDRRQVSSRACVEGWRGRLGNGMAEA